MPDTSTRQRLLELMEKWPELRLAVDISPGGVYMGSQGPLSDPEGDAILCDAMVRWLAEAHAHPEIDVGVNENLGVRLTSSRYGCKAFFMDTLTDALISAVEAVKYR